MLDDQSTIFELRGRVSIHTVVPSLAPSRLTLEELPQWQCTKDALISDLTSEFGLSEKQVRHAVAEAEAIAALTEFPRFFWWVLAAEKAATLQEWHRYQRDLLQRTDFSWSE